MGIRRFLVFASLVLSFLLFFAGPALSIQTKNIAVSRVTTTSAVLVVKTDSTADVTVQYGSAPGSYSVTKQATGLVRHEILLDGLPPSSRIYYRVTVTDAADPAASVILPEKSFHTSRSAGQPFSFAVVADNRPGVNAAQQPAVFSTMLGQMEGEGIDLAFDVGDLIYGLGTDTLNQYVAKYDGFFAATTGLTESVPLYTAVGNHEYVNFVSGRTAYEQEFTLPVNNGADSATYGEHYYSFDHGDTHFIVLSTEIPGQAGVITGNQKAWLVQDLGSTSKKWIVAFMHRPLFSGTHAGDPWVNISNPTGQQNKAEIHDLFRQYGVDVVFEGHDHFYLRHIESGIQHIITGGGGSPLYNLPLFGPGDVFGAKSFEHVKVDETSDSLRLTAIDSAGSTLESFTLGVPGLNLARTNTYWASYDAWLARDLSVEYSLANNGPGDAADLQAVYLMATNGVSSITVPPVSLGDLKAGQSAPLTLHYVVPAGVVSFKATTYVTCSDLAGSSYAFPGPAPVY